MFAQTDATNASNIKTNIRQKLINRAKIKSLRMSVTIVAAFIICWTPYYTLMLIFMFTNLDERV